MSGEHPQLDALQAAYKDAVEVWITTIHKEEVEVKEIDQRPALVPLQASPT